MTPKLDAQQTALVELGLALRAAGYVFVTPTPETHRRVNGRPENLVPFVPHAFPRMFSSSVIVRASWCATSATASAGAVWCVTRR
jgi:hypothetical protein